MNHNFLDYLKGTAMKNKTVITLMTDFGVVDGFVGVMKGVILQIAPDSRMIDVTHDIPPFSITSAAFLNEWSFGYFPVGSVHLCLVDPGVGTDRRILITETCGHIFVAPDNGLLTPIFERPEPVRIINAVNQRYWMDKISHTFHGRDIFAPLAAHIASGVAIDEMGEEINDPLKMSFKQPVVAADSIECRVCHIDRFGNLITNLDQPTFLQWIKDNNLNQDDIIVQSHNYSIDGITQAYGIKNQGDMLAVFDGYDRLEIAINGGSASHITGLGFDAPVYIRIA